MSWGDWIRTIEVEPSLYAADFSRLGEQVEVLLRAEARVFHFDVGDGHFVPPITTGPIVLQSIAPLVHGAGGILDCHLMVESPERHLAQFREAGYLPEALMNYIALLGWSPTSEGSEVISPAELVKQFRIDRVNKSPAVFDVTKLNFINRHYLKSSPSAPQLLTQELQKAGWMPSGSGEHWVRMVADTVAASVDTVTQVPAALENVLAFPLDNLSEIRDTLDDPGAIELIRRFAAELIRIVGFHAFIRNFSNRLERIRMNQGLLAPVRNLGSVDGVSVAGAVREQYVTVRHQDHLPLTLAIDQSKEPQRSQSRGLLTRERDLRDLA